jgi:4-methylaminobutanoate oxidase (formaldehyde-forming)
LGASTWPSLPDDAHVIMTVELPARARVVIIGGGIIGCSVAYHLADAGCTDVVVLERHQLTAGTTWHAAGLIVAGGFHSETYLDLFKRSRHLYRDVLEAETEQATGYSQVGYIQLATSDERAEALRRDAAFQRLYGLDSVELTPREVGELWPLANVDDAVCGIYWADQGRANPADCTMALAKGARRRGVTMVEGCAVTGIEQRDGRVVGVATDRGRIEAEHVVNCAGLWGREIGKLAGVDLPLQAAEHYYVITDQIEGVERTLPVLEIPDYHGYFREETGGIMVGLFEPEAKPWGVGPAGPPTDRPFATLEPDWDRIVPYAQRALQRLPSIADIGIRSFFCGPESFVPDLNPLVGEVPGLRNFWVACGLNSLGILLGGGVGELLARWILDGAPPTDVVEIDVARVAPHHNSARFLAARTREALGVLFGDAAWPNHSFRYGRGARRSPIHDRLLAAGAEFTDFVGWEYPEWFGPTDETRPSNAYTWGRPEWWDRHAAEHHAVRTAVGLIDLTFMGKFWVEGRDAEAFLDEWAAGDVAMPVGRCLYTTALDDDGRIRADITITRHAADRYMVVCGPETITRTEAWLRRRRDERADLHVVITDVTSGFAILNLQGPRSRELLACLTDADLSTEAFPYQTMRTIDVHYARVHAQRMTYSGELGFELFVPTEMAVSMYDAIVEAGAAFGLAHIGLATLDSLRLEKANRDYTHDVDNWDNPIEAGLKFTCAFDTGRGFRGREALLSIKDAIPRRRLVQVALDDPTPLLRGNEPLLRDDAAVGYVRAGAYGHTLGRAVGLAMIEADEPVTKAWIDAGRWETLAFIDRAATPVPTTVSLRPFYDPSGERARV